MPEWIFRTSSRCSKGNCVEVAPLPDGGAAVRDSKDRSQAALVFDGNEWSDFLAAVRAGEFDFAPANTSPDSPQTPQH